MNKQSVFLWLVLLVLAVAVPAGADTWPPVNVLAVGGPQYAEPGKPVTLELEVSGGATVALADFRIEGKGWRAVKLEAPRAWNLDKGDRLVIDVTLMAGDPDEPVQLAFEIDGRTWRKTLDLSRRHYDLVTEPQPLSAVSGPQPEPWVRPAYISPEPVQDADSRPAGTGGEETTGKSGAERRTIRVHGRFAYTREDDVLMGADGVSVHVYDKEALWDNEVAVGITDAFGYYDLTFDWFNLLDPDPDLFIRFRAENSRISIKDATDGVVYQWSSGIRNDFSGSDWDVGTLQPAAGSQFPALHILTDLVRDWRWDANVAGYDNPHLDCYWPEVSNGAYYSHDGIHVPTGSQWNETTHAHEYGHFWMDTYGESPAADYCNGICDASATECGHCQWCEENSGVAWLEGWAEFCGDIKASSYEADYGLAARAIGSVEDLDKCGAAYRNPIYTEGFAAALLRDIADSDQDSNGVFAGGKDALALGFHEIYTVTELDVPMTPMSFLARFRTRYPEYDRDLWQTAWNCGYDIDAENPEPPTNITSTSHERNVPSTDPTITFTWTGAEDDASGVDYYMVLASGYPTHPGGYGTNIGNVESWTTDVLQPGHYYLCIATYDRTGKFSSYASVGPYIIAEPEPAELEFTRPDLWDHRMVVRDAVGATETEAHDTASLPGDELSTYWNAVGINNGEADVSQPISASLFIDGVHPGYPFPSPDLVYWSSAPPGVPRPALDKGPIMIRGGRHILSAMIDANDVIAEGNEANNTCGRQFVWTPITLTAGTAVQRAAPPDKMGGYDDLDIGQVFWYDCDGLRADMTGWWSAVVARPLAGDDDYDLRLHEASTGSGDGFGASLAVSSRPAGLLDAVISNRNTLGPQLRDVGILNQNGGASYYRAVLRTSTGFIFGDSTTVAFAQDEMLKLLEVYVAAADTGFVSAAVAVNPADGPVAARWLDRSFTQGGLSDELPLVAVSDADGRIRLDMHLGETGYYCLVIYRDPEAGTGTLDATVEIQRTPPDFTPCFASGWHSPLVPRPAADGTPALVALPDTLHGNTPSTYLNVAVLNESPNSGSGLATRLFFDGVYTAWVSYGEFGGYAHSLFNWGQQLTMRGGRHTVSMHLDDEDLVEEIREDNNIYAEQYCWSPLLLSSGSPLTRSGPPARTGGWSDAANGEQLWYNCDGMRFEHQSWWQAVAVMPAASDRDIDIRLHDALGGVKEGFKAYHSISTWGPGQSDFVLANYNLCPDQPFDAGVLAWNTGSTYAVELVNSVFHSSYQGGLGPFTLGENRILDLHEFYLSPGSYTIDLLDGGGGVDWGLTLHRYDQPWQGKAQAVTGGIAWLEGPGRNEYLTVEIPVGGYYCLSVWKQSSEDLPRSGSYSLRINGGMSGAGDMPGPAVTRLAGVHPNPFNPRTTVAFELAQASQVRVGVYDLRGALVKTLVAEHLDGGRHEAVWDGTDNAGQRSASGVYMVRLEAGEVRQMKKVVLVK